MAVAPRGNHAKLIALFAVLACLSNFQDAYPNSYPNTAYGSFQTFINDSYMDRGFPTGLTETQFSWLWSAMLNIWAIGYLTGTFVAPFFTERFGRKFTLIGSNTGSIVGTTLAVVAISCEVPELLFTARLCSSLMSGISCSALFLFLQETSPTSIRGTTSFLSETAYLIISVFGMGMGMDNILGKHLPFLVGVHLLAGIAAVILVSTLKETPKYLLITRGDHVAALGSLQFYRGADEANETVIENIQKEAQEGYEAPFLSSIPMVLKTPHLRQAFFVGFCALQITLSIIPINYVSTKLLEAHFPPQMAQIGSFVFIACNFIASIFGALAVDRFGRRPLLLSFALLNTLSLCSYCVFDRLAFYVNEQFKYGCIVSLIAYGITFGGGLGPIAFFITTELVPQQFRSAVQSMAFTTNTAINFIFSFVTLPLYEAIDIWSLIPLFIGPSFIAWTYLLFKLPETRGREIHEIVRELAGGTEEVDFDSTIDYLKSPSSPTSIKNQSVSGDYTESTYCSKQSQANSSSDLLKSSNSNSNSDSNSNSNGDSSGNIKQEDQHVNTKPFA